MYNTRIDISTQFLHTVCSTTLSLSVSLSVSLSLSLSLSLCLSLSLSLSTYNSLHAHSPYSPFICAVRGRYLAMGVIAQCSAYWLVGVSAPEEETGIWCVCVCVCVRACVCVEGGGGGGACARACVRACLLTERIMQARCRSTARRFLRRCSMSRRSGRCALKQRSARRCRDTMRSAAQRMRGERQKETERDRERKNARPPPRAAAAVTPLRDRKTKTDGQRGGTVKWRGAQEQRRH